MEEEAKILQEVVRRYEYLSYAELKQWVLAKKKKVEEISAHSGESYQVELEAFWDDRAKQNIRFMGSIEDNRFSFKKIFKPALTASFILKPDGTKH